MCSSDLNRLLALGTGNPRLFKTGVFDFSNPALPRQIGEIAMAIDPRRFATYGDHWVLARNQGLEIYDGRDPLAPVPVGQYQWLWPQIFSDVAVQGNQAVVAANDWGVAILDLKDAARPQLLGHYPGAARKVIRDRSRVFVLGGQWDQDAQVQRDGLVALDISRPAHPIRLGGMDRRDWQAWPAYSDGQFYVARVTPDREHTFLDVLDVSDPTQFRWLGRSNYLFTTLPQDVKAVGNLVFCAGGGYEPGQYALEILDVSDAAAPRRIGTFGESDWAYEVLVAGDRAYLWNGEGTRVLDISNPTEPRAIAFLPFHIQAVQGPHGFELGPEGFMLSMFDRNAALPRVRATVPSEPYFWPSTVATKGNLIFVAGEGDGGLRIFHVGP